MRDSLGEHGQQFLRLAPPPARRLHYGINQFGSGPGFFHGFNIDKGIFSIAAKLTQAGYHGRDR